MTSKRHIWILSLLKSHRVDDMDFLPGGAAWRTSHRTRTTRPCHTGSNPEHNCPQYDYRWSPDPSNPNSDLKNNQHSFTEGKAANTSCVVIADSVVSNQHKASIRPPCCRGSVQDCTAPYRNHLALHYTTSHYITLHHITATQHKILCAVFCLKTNNQTNKNIWSIKSN